MSWILQFRREDDRDGAEKVMSMIEEHLWLANVGSFPELRMSAPTLMIRSSRVLPLGLSRGQPHKVLCALESIEQR